MNFLAYVDPGSGLLAWQIVVAGAVGCLFQIRKFRNSVARLGRRLLGRH
jgi:hypothetical protein